MNWWNLSKQAKIEDWGDRNRVNRGIHRLEDLSEYLEYASELIYMTGRGARQMVAEIRQNKTLSTYPEIEEVLLQADTVALDSPGKFSVYCKAAAEAIADIAADLEQQRSDWANKDAPKMLKGLVDE